MMLGMRYCLDVKISLFSLTVSDCDAFFELSAAPNVGQEADDGGDDEDDDAFPRSGEEIGGGGRTARSGNNGIK